MARMVAGMPGVVCLTAILLDDSAAEAQECIASLPLLRPGEVLELVPGMIVSQHSGDGKANQYYLRGFNLDHGTDFRTTVALWWLDIASELLFVGDAGVTEPSRPSRRHGLEWTNLYVANAWLAFDADLAASQERFRGDDPAGAYIPGAVAFTANLGLTVDNLGPWFGALRIRHFGPRSLIEDNSVRSASTTLANFRLGCKIDPHTHVTFDVLNLFDHKASDIDYWYESQLRGEAAPVADIHTHPAEPRTARLTVAYRF